VIENNGGSSYNCLTTLFL